MKEITKNMIKEFKIKELGFDFMGYIIPNKNYYSFHHLIIPSREGGKCERWNGAILNDRTSHPYLHLIESKDYDMFCYITNELIDINFKGYIDFDNIRNIHNLLSQFEREHCSDRTRKGKLLIKDEYTRRITL